MTQQMLRWEFGKLATQITNVAHRNIFQSREGFTIWMTAGGIKQLMF